MVPKLGKDLARPFSFTAALVITMMKCYFNDAREGVRGDTFLEAVTLGEDCLFCLFSFFSSRFLTDSSMEQLISSDIMHGDLLHSQPPATDSNQVIPWTREQQGSGHTWGGPYRSPCASWLLRILPSVCATCTGEKVHIKIILKGNQKKGKKSRNPEGGRFSFGK